MKHRSLILSVLAVAILAGIPMKSVKAESAAAPAPAADQSLEGTYKVTGTNPGDKSKYAGMVTVTKASDGTYKFDWKVGTAYTGTGKREGNKVTVDFTDGGKNAGVVTYTLQADGSLDGTWFIKGKENLLGTELLKK